MSRRRPSERPCGLRGVSLTLIDYHVHLLGHLDVEDPAGRLTGFLGTAMKRGIEEIGFADHDKYLDMLDFPALSRTGGRFPRLKIRAGLEFDYIPGRENEARAIADAFRLDYLIGSVHSVDGWGIDEPEQAGEWRERNVDEVYARYYALISRAASTEAFDIIGHLDLPKVFGYRPKEDPVALAMPALLAIKDAKCVVEVNTNGMYKPAGEMYPAPELLEKCFEMGIPVTLGSDAHVPENAGRDIALAWDLVRRKGYTRLATFIGRQRVMRAV